MFNKEKTKEEATHMLEKYYNRNRDVVHRFVKSRHAYPKSDHQLNLPQ